MAAGGEIRRVGLDQDAVRRQRLRDGAQLVRFLEGQDAGEGDEKPERDRAARELATAGVAMKHGREGALRRLLLQYPCHVLVRLARMDDERQAGRPRRGDVVAEATLLRLARAV